jgi:hypothetical protein
MGLIPDLVRLFKNVPKMTDGPGIIPGPSAFHRHFIQNMGE